MLNKPHLLIIIMASALIMLTQSLNYRISKQLNATILDASVSEIALIGENQLVVSKSNETHTTFTYLSGQSFQTITKVIPVKNQPSNTKITSQGIYVNYGNQINQRSNDEQIYQNSVLNMQGNLLLSSNKQYLAISKKTTCPTLAFLNLTTMETNQIQYQRTNCTFDFSGFVKEVGNGEIAYAARQRLFIIDGATFALKQMLIQSQLYSGNDFSYLDTYYDKLTNSSVILLKGQSNYETFIRKSGSQQFQQQGRFNNPTSLFTLTGLNKGVSFEGTKLYEWEDMATNILALEFKTDDQYLFFKKSLAVSHSQNMIVLAATSGKDIYFYSLQQNYTMTKLFTIQILQSVILRSAQFSSDDKYLFIQGYYQLKNTYYVYRVDIQNQNYTIITNPLSEADRDNCTSFGLLDSIEFDRLVLTCSVQVYNNQTNRTDLKYFLQLRKISDLELIHSVQLLILLDKPVLRLIASPMWSQSFLLQIIDEQIYQFQDNCDTTLYKLLGDQMISISNEYGVSFHRARPVGKFLASLKFAYNDVPDHHLKIYHPTNLSLFTEVYVENGGYETDNYVYFQGSILLIQQNFNHYRADFYDFKSDSADEWFQGSLYRRYFKKGIQYDTADQIIFPKRKLYYLYNYASFGSEKPTKIIYNLGKLPIKRILQMQKSSLTPQGYLYITNEYPNCPTVFYMTNKILNKFEHCSPQKGVQKINIDPGNKFMTINFNKLFLASSQRHIILLYSVYGYSTYIVQIRQISQPEILIYMYSTDSQVYNVDYTLSGLFVYNERNYIITANIGGRELADKYQIMNFARFDVNNKGCIVMAGPLIIQPSRTRIIVKNSTKQQQYSQLSLEGVVEILKVDQASSMITIYLNQTIEVWENGQEFVRLYWESRKDVKDLRFVGLNSLFVQSSNSTQIIHFRTLQKRDPLQTQKAQNSKIKFEITEDGKVYVKSTDLRVVVISSVSDNSESLQFNLPGSQEIVTGLSFSANNNLVISTQLNSLYYLNPLPCPSTFITNNLFCQCRANSNEDAGICKCRQNFVEENQQCLCPQSFNTTNEGECLCLSKFVENGVCIKCQFPCQTCQNNTKNCLSYSTDLVILIIGSCFIFLSIVTVVLMYIRRKKLKKKDADRLNEDFEEI